MNTIAPLTNEDALDLDLDSQTVVAVETLDEALLDQVGGGSGVYSW